MSTYIDIHVFKTTLRRQQLKRNLAMKLCLYCAHEIKSELDSRSTEFIRPWQGKSIKSSFFILVGNIFLGDMHILKRKRRNREMKWHENMGKLERDYTIYTCDFCILVVT